ncbi:ATP-binding cassette domain-containing protein [Granulicatella sp. zg-ZJ]|uniref:ABC transporter ATP-binding protein n=1 Tax=Granulicatella sp. zg-ZJ TaxID=2678504 RepID=UPI0013D2E9DC|nr:ABC transporter ATP-binding protein [Granulicatella sp. zg-ZJ]NEW62256.1 ATP-binding cassette domain-containing protein [Granulicatella sp. zg-ZJ]
MIKLFKRLTKKEILMILLSTCLVAFQVFLELKIPEYMSDITKLLQTKGTTTADIFNPGSKMIGLSLVSLLASVTVGFLAARVAASFTASLRRDIFNRVMDYSQAEIQQFSIPSLLTRTTNDVTQMQIIIALGLQVTTKGPIMAIWAVTKIIGKSTEWMLATVVAVFVLILMLLALITLAFPKQSLIQQLTDKLNGLTREKLMGLRVVRAYNAQTYENKKFEKANDNVTRTNIFVSSIMSLMQPVMTLISSGLTLAVYFIGARLINDAAMPDKVTIFSDMVVFSSYAMQVVIGFMLMTIVFMILPRVLVSAKRINAVLELSSSIQYPTHSKETNGQVGDIVFRDVSFKYSPEAEPVIEHISFSAKAGETVAFIGSTGSGKSTLVNLIPRFYDVTSGAIEIDGVDIREYSRNDLYQKVGYIPQKAVLFSGTINQNLDFGSSQETPLSQEAMWEALELTQSKHFVEEKENALFASVSQGGTNFSGGQRQRLAIARALARKPEILIFDDSFSALDYKTDRMLRETLAKQTASMTKLIVAQRISTIMDADQIIVLDKGQVVGKGTHEQLLQSNEVYQEIAYSQLSKEELAHGK